MSYTTKIFTGSLSLILGDPIVQSVDNTTKLGVALRDHLIPCWSHSHLWVLSVGKIHEVSSEEGLVYCFLSVLC